MEFTLYNTVDTCHQLVQYLVVSQLDYAKSLLYGLPSSTLAPLRIIQHRAAELILKRGRYSSASDALTNSSLAPEVSSR